MSEMQDVFNLTWVDIVLWLGGAVLVFGVVVFFLILYAKSRSEEMNEVDERAAARFENSMVQAFEKASPSPSSERNIDRAPSPSQVLSVDSPPWEV